MAGNVKVLLKENDSRRIETKLLSWYRVLLVSPRYLTRYVR